MPATEVFSADVSITLTGLDGALKQLVELNQVASKAAESLSKLGGLNLSFKEASADLDKFKSKVESISKLKVNVQKSEIGSNVATQVATDLNTIQAEVQKFAQATTPIMALQTQLNNLREVGSLATDSLIGKVGQFNSGLRLAFSDSGNAVAGFRLALFGLGSTTNPLGRALDSLMDETSAFGRTWEAVTNIFASDSERFKRDAKNTAESLLKFSQSIAQQSAAVKQLATEELDGKAAASLAPLNYQLNQVTRSMTNMLVAVQSGSKVNQSEFRLQAEAVTKLRNVFELLVSQGIVKAGTATHTEFMRMIADTEHYVGSTKILVSQTEASRRKAEQAAQKNQEHAETWRKLGKESEYTGTIFQRLTINFSNLFSLFNRGNTSINSTTQALRSVSQEAQSAAGKVSILRDVFLGTFGGTFLANMFSDVTRAIGQQFFDLNNTIQNTRITISGMLAGSRVDAEQAIAGFTAFVEEQVAKTPFEVADAVSFSLRLIQQGFDPKEWFTPAANAAAAMNKPMEQFLGGLVKIMNGARGAGIDMLRDFGLNVNNITGYFDEATGKALNFEEVQKRMADGTIDQTQQLGLEFNKQGELITSTTDVMRIMNAYLLQNATFAQAAEARSKSLTGVWSNMKDAFSRTLIAFGQPIFDKLTFGATGLLDAINRLSPTIISFASQLGTAVAGAIDYVVGLFDGSLLPTIAGSGTAFSNLASLILSIVQGEWATAWQLVQEIVASAAEWVIQTLFELGANGFNWGVSFVVQIANGIYEAAQSILIEAVNYVGEIISSFLEPGSPPEQGPLSTIDKWGAGLLDTLIDGMGAADIDRVTDVLTPIADTIAGFNNHNRALEPFKAIREDAIRLVGALEETGEINEDLYQQMVERIRATAENDVEAKNAEEAIAQLRTRLELEAKLKKSTDAIKSLREEVAQAEAKGFIPAELIERLRLAEEQGKQAEEQVTAEEAKQASLEKLYDLDSKIYEDMSEKKMAGVGALAAAAQQAAKKEVETWDQAYARESKALEERKHMGIISEEEYLNELLRLEEKWVEDAQKNGVVAGMEEHVQSILKTKARLEEITGQDKKLKEGIDKTFQAPSVQDIFARFAEEAPKKMVEIGKATGQQFVAYIKSESTSRLAEAATSIRNTITEKFASIFDGLKKLITPQNLPFIAAIAGGIATLIAPGILSGLGAVIGLIGTLAITVGRLLLTFGKFSLIGLVITAIILNWDKIVPLAVAAWEKLSAMFATFVEKAGGIETLTAKVKVWLNNLNYEVLKFVKTFGDGVYEAIVNLDFTAAKTKLIQAFSGIDFSTILGGAKGILQPLLDTINAELGPLKEKLLGLVPPGVVEQFNKITLAVRAFFAEGRLGGELLKLFQALGALWTAILPILKVGFAILLILIAAVVDVLVSFASSFVSILPFIEQVVTGIVQFITGLIQVVTGFIYLFRAGFALLTGDTDTFSKLIAEAFVSFSQGVSNALGGLLRILANTGLAILTFVSSFVLNMVGLALSFIPGFEQAGAAILVFKDYLVFLFTSLSAEVGTIITQLVIILPVLMQDAWTTIINGILTFIASARTAFTDFWLFLQTPWLANFASQVSTDLAQFGSDFVAKLAEWATQASTEFSNMWTGIIGFFASGYDTVMKTLDTFVTDTIAYFTGLYNELVGNSIVPDMMTEIILYFTNLSTDILALLPQMIVDVAAGFVTLGAKLIMAVAQGVMENIGSVGTTIKNAIAGLFGGGEETSTGDDTTAFISSATTQMTTFQTTLATIFTAIQVGWSTTLLNMGLNWTTFLTAATTAWTLFHLALTTALMLFDLDFSTRMTNLGIRWQALTIFIQTTFNAAIVAVTLAINNFGIRARLVIQSVILAINQAITALKNMGETSAEVASDMEDDFDRVIEILKDLIEIVEETALAFEKMAESAKKAADAIRDAGESGARMNGGGGGPSAQGGAWKTWEGMWQLHDNEMVLPAKVADAMRSLVDMIAGHGIGDMAIPAVAFATATPNARGLEMASLGGTPINVEINNTVSSDLDLNLLDQRILRTITRAVGRGGV